MRRKVFVRIVDERQTDGNSSFRPTPRLFLSIFVGEPAIRVEPPGDFSYLLACKYLSCRLRTRLIFHHYSPTQWIFLTHPNH